MRIHQNRALEGLTLAAIEVCQGGESLAVGLHSSVLAEQFSPGLEAIAVGQLHGTTQIRVAEATGQEGINRGFRGDRQPGAAAISVEAGHLQLTVLEQAGIGRITHILHRIGTDEAVEMAAASVTTGIHVEGTTGFRANRHRLVPEAAEGCVLDHRLIRCGRIHLHHPSVFVARQAVDVAEATQLSVAADEGAFRWSGRTSIGMDRFRHLGLEVLLGAEHRAPGGGATTAVGECADDLRPQAIVVALTFSGGEHRLGRSAAAQTLGWIIQTGDAGDATVLLSIGPAPVALAIPLQRHHTDAEIRHRFIRHGADLGPTGIIGSQRRAIDHAIQRLQRGHEGSEGQGAAHHLLESLDPGDRADVLEIHRHRGPRRVLLHKAEVIVVEAKAAGAEAIAPGRQEIGVEPLRHGQSVLERQLPVGALLLAGREAIAVHRQRHLNRLKGNHCTGGLPTHRQRTTGQAFGRQNADATEAQQGQHGTSTHGQDLNRCRKRRGAD